MTVSSASHSRPHIPLRIAVVQYCPKIGQVDENLKRARELCSKLEPHTLDLLCFPEMAFTGYVFDSAEAVLPYLETPCTGSTSRFCTELAERLHCYVACGYPERLSEDEPAFQQVESPSDTQPVRAVGANSAVIYGPDGNCVGHYRKTNLFETDMSWAKPGPGFSSFKLPLPPWKGTVTSVNSLPHSRPTALTSTEYTLNLSLGICMDLNPQPLADGKSAEWPYELADYCTRNQTKLLVLLNAWLDPTSQSTAERDENDEDQNQEEPAAADDDDEPEWQTLNYWAERLSPLWRSSLRRKQSDETIYSDDSTEQGGSDHIPVPGECIEEGEEEHEEQSPHETIVVACNRIGKENGKTFAGSSAIFSMRTGSGRPKLLDMMGRREEGVRVWNLFI